MDKFSLYDYDFCVKFNIFSQFGLFGYSKVRLVCKIAIHNNKGVITALWTSIVPRVLIIPMSAVYGMTGISEYHSSWDGRR